VSQQIVPPQLAFDGEVDPGVGLEGDYLFARSLVGVGDLRTLVAGDEPALLSSLQLCEFVFRPVRERKQSRCRGNYVRHCSDVGNDAL